MEDRVYKGLPFLAYDFMVYLPGGVIFLKILQYIWKSYDTLAKTEFFAKEHSHLRPFLGPCADEKYLHEYAYFCEEIEWVWPQSAVGRIIPEVSVSLSTPVNDIASLVFWISLAYFCGHFVGSLARSIPHIFDWFISLNGWRPVPPIISGARKKIAKYFESADKKSQTSPIERSLESNPELCPELTTRFHEVFGDKILSSKSSETLLLAYLNISNAKANIYHQRMIADTLGVLSVLFAAAALALTAVSLLEYMYFDVLGFRYARVIKILAILAALIFAVWSSARMRKRYMDEAVAAFYVTTCLQKVKDREAAKA